MMPARASYLPTGEINIAQALAVWPKPLCACRELEYSYAVSIGVLRASCAQTGVGMSRRILSNCIRSRSLYSSLPLRVQHFVTFVLLTQVESHEQPFLSVSWGRHCLPFPRQLPTSMVSSS